MRAHWGPPDVAGDVLAVARRTGAAEAREIRVRPDLRDRMLRESPGRPPITDLDGIPLVVDDSLPAHPGFEIHRAVSTTGARTDTGGARGGAGGGGTLAA